MRIFVGYASQHGSTLGIAERLARQLRTSGHHVDLWPLTRDRAATGYDAYVLGSAVHNGAWFSRATEFVYVNRDLLAARPVWLFSVGMTGQEPKDLAGFYRDIHPVDHCLFTGAVERRHLPFAARVFYRTRGGQYGDFRDWKAVDAWARLIALHLAEVPHDA